MYTQINYLPYLMLGNGEYKFIGAFKDSVHDGYLDEKDLDERNYPQLSLPIGSILDENYFVNSDGIIEEYIPTCKNCGSKKHIRKDFNERLIYLDDGTPLKVKVKRYKCKNCGKKYQVEFTNHWDKFCNYPNKIKNKARKALQHGWISLRNIRNHFKDLLGINISHETIRKYLKNDNNLYWLNEDIKLSGYYGYDAQWVRIERKWHYRLVLFDIINNVPVACLLSKKESSQIVKNFIEKSIPLKDRKAIITDLKQDYDKIMRELCFAHQHCTFHLVKNMYETFKPHITKILNEYKEEILKNEPQIPKTKLKELIKEKKEEVKKEITNHIELCYELFHQKSFKEAENYIKLLKQKLKTFPKFMQDYLTKKFFPNYRKFLVFLENPYIGKLESTNNKIENYFGNTLDKHTKKIYRTLEGLFDYIMARKEGWIENRNQDLTN